MDQTMVDFINEQPQALRRIFDGRKAITAVFTRLYTEHRPDRLYLLGSGTSYNATAVSAPFMQEILGIEVFDCPSSRLPSIPANVKRPMFCVISQGGRSTNSIAAIEQYKAYPVLAITASEESIIAKRYSDRHMLLACGPETVGPMTKGYTTTILTFYLCALEAALAAGVIDEGAYGAWIGKIDAMITAMSANIERTFAWYREKEDALANTNKYVFTGKEIGQRTALESALKILETVKYPAMAYEFEEYLHGPIMMGDEKLCLIGFVPCDADGERMRGLLKFFRDKITPCSWAVTGDADKACAGDLVLDISCEKHLAPFAHILPGQVMSALLPARMGREDVKMQQFHDIDAVVHIKAKEEDAK